MTQAHKNTLARIPNTTHSHTHSSSLSEVKRSYANVMRSLFCPFLYLSRDAFVANCIGVEVEGRCRRAWVLALVEEDLYGRQKCRVSGVRATNYRISIHTIISILGVSLATNSCRKSISDKSAL